MRKIILTKEVVETSNPLKFKKCLGNIFIHKVCILDGATWSQEFFLDLFRLGIIYDSMVTQIWYIFFQPEKWVKKMLNWQKEKGHKFKLSNADALKAPYPLPLRSSGGRHLKNIFCILTVWPVISICTQMCVIIFCIQLLLLPPVLTWAAEAAYPGLMCCAQHIQLTRLTGCNWQSSCHHMLVSFS